jgi:hypothetical protein
VQFDQLADQGKTDAGTFVATGPGSGHPMEPLEQVRQITGRYPDAGVRDGQFSGAATAGQPHRDGAVKGELQGVGEQIQDDLLPQIRIHVDLERQGWTVHDQLQPGPLRRRLERAGQPVGEIGQVDRLKHRPGPAGLETGKVQHSIDQLEQP